MRRLLIALHSWLEKKLYDDIPYTELEMKYIELQLENEELKSQTRWCTCK